MPLWRRPKKTAQQPKALTDDEMRVALRQQVMSDLSRGDGLIPEYREDIASEEDFEILMPEMPTIAVWGERWTDDGLAFSLSVNGERVAATIEKYIHRDDPWFRNEYQRVVRDLQYIVRNTITSTFEKTGANLSEICETAYRTR